MSYPPPLVARTMTCQLCCRSSPTSIAMAFSQKGKKTQEKLPFNLASLAEICSKMSAFPALRGAFIKHPDEQSTS